MLKMLSHLIEDLKQSTAKYKRVSLDKSQYKSEGQKHKNKTMYFIMCKLISKTYLHYKMKKKKPKTTKKQMKPGEGDNRKHG